MVYYFSGKQVQDLDLQENTETKEFKTQYFMFRVKYGLSLAVMMVHMCWLIKMGETLYLYGRHNPLSS